MRRVLPALLLLIVTTPTARALDEFRVEIGDDAYMAGVLEIAEGRVHVHRAWLEDAGHVVPFWQCESFDDRLGGLQVGLDIVASGAAIFDGYTLEPAEEIVLVVDHADPLAAACLRFDAFVAILEANDFTQWESQTVANVDALVESVEATYPEGRTTYQDETPYWCLYEGIGEDAVGGGGNDASDPPGLGGNGKSPDGNTRIIIPLSHKSGIVRYLVIIVGPDGTIIGEYIVVGAGCISIHSFPVIYDPPYRPEIDLARLASQLDRSSFIPPPPPPHRP